MGSMRTAHVVQDENEIFKTLHGKTMDTVLHVLERRNQEIFLKGS